MTKEWYKSKGYNLSINIDQAMIDKAERDAFIAYVKPILPTVEIDAEDIADELSELAFMLLLRRTLVVTRSGTKEKTNSNSQNAREWQALSEQAVEAAWAVELLRKRDGAVKDAEVTDIASIYFKSNFISL